MLNLLPSPSRADILHAQVGPFHIHVTILDEIEDGDPDFGAPDPDGRIAWCVTASPDRAEWRSAIWEGYSDSLQQAKQEIEEDLKLIATSIAQTLGEAP